MAAGFSRESIGRTRWPAPSSARRRPSGTSATGSRASVLSHPRHEPAGLLGEVDQDRTGFEHCEILAVAIHDCRDPAVRADLQEFRALLLELAKAERVDGVGKRQLFERDRNLVPLESPPCRGSIMVMTLPVRSATIADVATTERSDMLNALRRVPAPLRRLVLDGAECPAISPASPASRRRRSRIRRSSA